MSRLNEPSVTMNRKRLNKKRQSKKDPILNGVKAKSQVRQSQPHLNPRHQSPSKERMEDRCKTLWDLLFKLNRLCNRGLTHPLYKPASKNTDRKRFSQDAFSKNLWTSLKPSKMNATLRLSTRWNHLKTSNTLKTYKTVKTVKILQTLKTQEKCSSPKLTGEMPVKRNSSTIQTVKTQLPKRTLSS